MANAYSIQRNRQGWLDPTDQDFTLKALMFKQQKYDANRAKVDSIVEQYKSLQVARGVDKDYINQRLEGLINNINQISEHHDYSSNAVTQSIQNHLGQVLDDNVLTAIQETNKIRKYQSEVEKIKEKDIKLYNPLNEAFGIAPAQDYLQSTELGAKIQGNLTYTPYSDIEGELQKTLLDIQTKAKDGSYEYEVSPGRLVKVTVNGKSQSELREIALGLMGDKYNEQFKINTWGKHGGFKNLEGTSESVDKYYDNLISDHDKDIYEYKASINGGKLSPEKETEIKTLIDSLEKQKLIIQSNRENFKKDPVSGLIAMEKDNVASRLGKSLGLLQTKSMEYKKDDYWFAAENLKLDHAKFEHTQQKDAADLQLKIRELDDKKQLELLKLSSTNQTDSEGNPISSGGFVQTDGVNTEDPNLPSNNVQVLNDIMAVRNEKTNIGKRVIQHILDINNGRIKNVNSDEKAQASDLLKHVNSLVKSTANKKDANQFTEGEIDEFMKVYSRADAYQDLAFLNIAGEQSSTGERSSKLSYKNLYSDAKNRFLMKKSLYEENRALAQQEEKNSKSPRHFTENENFKNYLNNSVGMLKNTQNFSKPLSKSDIGKLNSLLLATGLSDTPTALENGSMSFQVTPKGTVSLKYQSKGKGEDDESKVKVTEINEISLENFKKFFPEVSKNINLNSERPLYTWRTLGTKELVSSPLAYLNPNSKNFSAFKEEASIFLSTSDNPTLDLNFLTKDGTKKIFNNVISRLPAKDRELGKQIVETVLNPNFMSKFKVITQYAPTANGSGKPNFIVSLINPKTKKVILSQNLGAKEKVDEYVKLNENQPQIFYSKLIGKELENMVVNSTQELNLTEGLENLINIAHGQ